MNRAIERLQTMGCDTAGALERVVDDEDFYMECLREALENPGFDGLASALAAGDAKEAFECAHALKGVLGSVGLTPMFQKTAEIVEPLRRAQREGLEQSEEMPQPSGEELPCKSNRVVAAFPRIALEEKLAELLAMRRRFAEIVA